MTGQEQRRYPRVPLLIFAWYCVIGDRTSMPEQPCEGIARTIDLSMAGVGLYTSHAVPPGTYMFIELTTANHAISLVGRAPYAHKLRDDYYQVGISVEIIPPNDRAPFEGLLRRAQSEST